MDVIKLEAEEVRWDLSFMYSSPEDPQIDKDVEALVGKMKKFRSSYKGKLGKVLGKAIADYSGITMLESKVLAYLFLCQSLNVGDAVVKSKIADAERIINKAYGEYVTFFDVESVKIEKRVLKKFYKNDPVVAKHRSWIEYRCMLKPHLLSEQVESSLVKRSLFGISAWSEFFDELEADLEFDFAGKKRTLTEMTHLLSVSKDIDERFKIMTVINSGLGGTFAKYSAQTLYVVAGLSGVENSERSYRHPMDERNKENRVSDAVVDVLHDAVKTLASSYSKRYYKLKTAHLGLKKLRWSDRNAPLPFSDTSTIPFGKAMGLVLEAYGSFSPTLACLIEKLVEDKRIDAPAARGKKGGAFNYPVVLPGGVPACFTFLNYVGSSRDVMTLAHELGHAVHGMLAGEAQGVLMFGAPIAFAETASIFGEMTTFNFLKKGLLEKGERESLLALTMEMIDDIIGTVVRQIGFSNFERRVHGMDKNYEKWTEPKKFSVEELNRIWLETTEEMYGENGEVFDYKNIEYLWSYVGHFHCPFYVYGYAFGQLLTSGLYARQSCLGDRFEPLYLDLLRSGSTKDVVELLKPFSLDPTDAKFWEDGIEAGLGALVREAERLSSDMGIVVGK